MGELVEELEEQRRIANVEWVVFGGVTGKRDII